MGKHEDSFCEDFVGTTPYRYPDIIKEYDAAWTHIKTPSPVKTKKTRPALRGSARAITVLNAAKELYQPGDVASPALIADKLGIHKSAVENSIKVLRSREMWIFRGGRKGLYYRKNDAH